MTESFGEGNIA